MTSAPVQPGDVLAGKYRVERVLGVGGMGVVVQATHVQLDERVALKFMLPEAMANAEIAGRFLREARLAVKLKSEHVAKVMDVGTLESGSPYIVMEFLQGEDLNHLVGKYGPLPFADVAEYVIQACDAIAEAHSMGIVHRDLKPANLFLTRRPDGAPLVKVLDFGISKANPLAEGGGAVTKTATMMGSPYFMSPEQMRSAKDVDARSDVWSVGVILYQLLTARLPFESDTLGGIMAAVFQDDPATLSRHRPDVPHAFQVLVTRCLQRDRNTRAQNVGEIAMTLAAYAPARAKPIADRIATLVGSGSSTDIMPSPLRAPSGTMITSPATGGGGATPGGPGAITGGGPVLGAGPITGSTTGATMPAGVPAKGSGIGIALGVLAILGAIGGVAFWASTRHGSAPTPAATTAPAATSVPTAAPSPTTPPSATSAATTAPVVTAAPIVTSAPDSTTAPAATTAHPVATTRHVAAVPAHRPPPPTRATPKPNVFDDRN